MRPFVPLILALAAGGCVPKGRAELLQVQLDATRVALASREDDLQRELAADAGRIAALEQEIADRQVQLDGLGARMDALDEALAEASLKEAEHTLLDQVSCVDPPVDPGPAPGPAPKPVPPGPPPDPPPPTPAQRRIHVDASVEAVAAALEESARREARRAHREARHQAVLDTFQALVDDELAAIEQTDDGTVVRVLVAKVFAENRTTLSPLGETVVQRLAAALRELPDHTVRIDGHTDDRAVYSAEHASNWELGFAYAVGVLRGLQEQGIPQTPVVASMAGQRPVDPSDSDEARRLNRRVELVLLPERGALQRFAPTPAPEDGTPPGDEGGPEDSP